MSSSTTRIAVAAVGVAAIVGGVAIWHRTARDPLAVKAPETPAASGAPSASAPALSAAVFTASPPAPHTLRPGEREQVILAPVYTIDKIYRSMMGPQSTHDIAFDGATKRQLVWITGMRANMVAEDGKTPMPPEFMCHCNLDVDPIKEDDAYGHHLPMSGRLFTLSQGQIDVELPEGFGIPVWSDQPVSLTTQVLNLNFHGQPFQVRHDVRITYVLDSEAKKPMKPLYMGGVFGMALLQGAHGGFDEENPGHGPSCMMGKAASDASYFDKQGKEFTGHWIVKPGREENHTPVTKILDLPFDTRIHAIAVHLHPFAESLTLNDLTTHKVVFEAKTKQLDGKIGLDHVDSYVSEEGIPIYKDHEYELVSVYNNTTNENQDSMAVMLLYMLDKEFTRDPPKKTAAATPAPSAPAPMKMGM